MKFENIYFINGTAYAGKSTLVKNLAEKYDGIQCCENYHNKYLEELNVEEYPSLTYIRDIKDWGEFVRRTPEEYNDWILGCIKECTRLEMEILEKIDSKGKKIFVDTNIPVGVLKEISDRDHVLIMLADQNISVERFFNRPDKEKQFIYSLLLKEDNPEKAIKNFKACLTKVNSREVYDEFLNSGFNVILRDENRPQKETMVLAERFLKLI